MNNENDTCSRCDNWRPKIGTEPRVGTCAIHRNDTRGDETCPDFAVYRIGRKPSKPKLEDFER